MKILLVNNETTKEDLGWIERSVELGLPERTNQIENLAMRLREYGDVEIIHHSDLDPAAVDADCVFLSGDFAPSHKCLISAAKILQRCGKSKFYDIFLLFADLCYFSNSQSSERNGATGKSKLLRMLLIGSSRNE